MKCLNVAHRGFSGEYPENTMLAFRKAVEVGCEGIEMDVQLTGDDQIVIIHDETIDRTSNGKGYVKDMTYEELCAFDFSSTYTGKVEKQQIPLLEEYLSFICDYDVITNIELKNGTFDYPQLEQKVYDLIQKYDLKEKIIISSFNHFSVLRMKKIDKTMRCGFLTESWLIDPASYVSGNNVECYHPYFGMLDTEMMAELTAKGVDCNTWTVNTEEDIQHMIDLGVSAIIGNFPNRVKALLEQNHLR